MERLVADVESEKKSGFRLFARIPVLRCPVRSIKRGLTQDQVTLRALVLKVLLSGTDR